MFRYHNTLASQSRLHPSMVAFHFKRQFKKTSHYLPAKPGSFFKIAVVNKAFYSISLGGFIICTISGWLTAKTFRRPQKGFGGMAAHSFETLKREKAFAHPSSDGHVNPILDKLAAPHIESFNSLFDDSGLDSGDTDGRGLLSLGLKDIGQKVVFSGAGSSSENPMGARLASMGRPNSKKLHTDYFIL